MNIGLENVTLSVPKHIEYCLEHVGWACLMSVEKYIL